MLHADDDLWDPEEVAFLRGKEVPNLISDCIIAMVREKPADPRAWLSKFFSKPSAKGVRLSSVEAPVGDEASVTVTAAGFTDQHPPKTLRGTSAQAVMGLANHLHGAPTGETHERVIQWAMDRMGGRRQSLGGSKTKSFRRGEGGDLDAREPTSSHKPHAPQTAVGPVPELVLPLVHCKEPVRMDATSLHLHQVIVLVSESGKVLYWNRAAHQATGIPPGSAVGQSIVCFLAGSAQSLLDEIRKAAQPVRRTLDDFEVGMQVWHDNRRDGVVVEITKKGQGDGMVVQYATGDKHKYRPGSVAQGKLRPLHEDREPPHPQSLAFQRADGVHRVRMELTVRGGPTAGYATLVGIQQRPGDHRTWVFDQLRRELAVLVKSTAEGTVPHTNAKRAEGVLLRSIDVDSSDWAPLRLQMLLSRLASDIDTMAGDWGVHLIVEPSGDKVPAEVSTHGVTLSNIVRHLLNNAVKFTGTEDQAQHKKNIDDRPRVRLCSQKEPGKMLSIAVIDSGPGVPEVFKEVLAGENKDESLCRGLRKAMLMAEELGGRLECRKKGHHSTGSDLRVLIPLVPAEDDVLLSPGSMCVTPQAGVDQGEGDDDISSPAGSLKGRSPVASPSGRGSPSGRRGSLVPAFKRMNLRCTVFVPAVVHRMSLMSQLWERSYVLAMAHTLPTEEELDGVELFIVDVHALGADPKDLFEFLQAVLMDADIEILLLHRYELNDLQKKQFKKRGYHTTQLPVTEDLNKTLDTIEGSVMDKRKERKEKEDIRAAFSKGISHVPWIKGRMLGRGSFGEVHEATCEMTGGKMAVKIIKIDTEKQDEAREKAVLGEVELMAQLNQDNILRYFYAERTQAELHIFMELATDGSLKSRVPDGIGLPEEEAAHFTVGVLRGLAYLHERGIVHRDIKADNVLVSRGVPKLCDFGTASRRGEGKALCDFTVGDTVVHDMRGEGVVFAMEDDKMRVRFSKGDEHGYNVASIAQGKIQLKVQEEKKADIAGTPHFMSPEVLGGDKATPASDAWATGCLLMELCTGKHPFAHKGSGWMPMRYVSLLKEGDEIDVGPKQYSVEARDFLLKCLAFCPDKRPRCSELLRSPFAGTAVDLVAKMASAPSPIASPKAAEKTAPKSDDPWASDEEDEEGSESESDGWGVPPDPDHNQARRGREEEEARQKEQADAEWESNFNTAGGADLLGGTLPTDAERAPRRASLHQVRRNSQIHVDPS
eukprot:Hpha_TRINITY_DN15515_c1_g3::TRINITY_DN15515_c1_g3_i1::g.106023::m.106023